MAFSALVGRRGALGLAGALVLLAAAVVFLASAPPAAAHDTCTHHHSDPDAFGSGAPNSVVCLRVYHTRLDVCDRDPDGHVVWARVHYSNGAIGRFEDYNGANGDCYQHYPPTSPTVYPISYNICVESEGCGQPIYRPGWGTPEW
jgi:hypothetical protein